MRKMKLQTKPPPSRILDRLTNESAEEALQEWLGTLVQAETERERKAG
jgi:hypothetical protein